MALLEGERTIILDSKKMIILDSEKEDEKQFY